MMVEFTKGEWIAGYGSGVTGPTCPTISGPTCGQATKFIKWANEGLESPAPKDEYTIVSKGCEVIAIVPFQEQGGEAEAKANARLIAAAKDLYAACKAEEKARAYIGRIDVERRLFNRAASLREAALAKADRKDE